MSSRVAASSRTPCRCSSACRYTSPVNGCADSGTPAASSPRISSINPRANWASTRAATRRAVSSGGLSSVIKIDWGSTDIVSLITKLTPSEIYNIGLALCKDTDLDSLLGAEGRSRRKKKTQLGVEYFGRTGINNLAGAKQLSSRGTFYPSTQELQPYDDLVDYDGHRVLTKRLALDYTIQVMVSARSGWSNARNIGICESGSKETIFRKDPFE